MPRKELTSLSDLMASDTTELEYSGEHTGGFVPDIITFCEDPKYIGPINLRPFQKIMLKVFYRGTQGNENTYLTDEEIKMIKDAGLVNDDNGDVLKKYNNGKIFRELLLVWGRRSGKDFCGAIIALYEALKIIEIPGGDPYKYYEIDDGTPIVILTVATAREQAGIAFGEIKSKLLRSPYFNRKLMKDGSGISTGAIWLLTPEDMKKNKEFESKNLPLTRGSIKVEVGHSNSDSLLGKGIFVLILDEVAAYGETGGAASGEVIYNKLTPSLTTYVRSRKIIDENGNIVYDENGKPKTEDVFDSKLVIISSPRGKDGIFYNLFAKAGEQETRLVCRLPTWVAHPRLTEHLLRTTVPGKDMIEEQFQMEFGAQFSGTASETFFPRECVEDIFNMGKAFKIQEIGKPGISYFAHLDPSSTSHNYALVIVHRELCLNPETGDPDFMIAVDHIKYWHPNIGKPVNVEEVDEYVIQLKKRFYLAMVTYDVWNSEASIKKLRKHSIPSKCTHYNSRYKMQIYDELYNLVIGHRIRIPYHELLRNEMLNLQRKWLASSYRVYPRKDGDVRTDDVLDALAGACYNAIASMTTKLPKSSVVNTGMAPTSNQRMWNSMSGPIGFGTGQEVSRRLENIKSWPAWKRR